MLKAVYYNPSQPGSFGGVGSLARAAGHPITKVSKWLEAQPTYTLHKPARKRNYPTRPYRTKGVDYQWQADLVEMIPYSRQNHGYKYILTLIDIFSRYAWAQPLKRKTPAEVVKALKIVFKKRRPLMYLQTDQGKEFENKIVHKFLASHGIQQFSVKSQFKAAMVERWNRTLKCRMWRYFTHVGNHKWVAVLPKLVEAYNSSLHRMIGMAPKNVNKKNEFELWLEQQKEIHKPRKNVLKVGDYVRVSVAKKLFAKGYDNEWTEEIFTIKEVIKKVVSPVTYRLQDCEKNVIEGVFYHEEVQRVDNPEIYKVEKVLRTKTLLNGQKTRLVKWLGYKQPTWTTSDIVKL
jgi:hypothetical protein